MFAIANNSNCFYILTSIIIFTYAILNYVNAMRCQHILCIIYSLCATHGPQELQVMMRISRIIEQNQYKWQVETVCLTCPKIEIHLRVIAFYTFFL